MSPSNKSNKCSAGSAGGPDGGDSLPTHERHSPEGLLSASQRRRAQSAVQRAAVQSRSDQLGVQ